VLLRGCFRMLFLYDVGEAFDLDKIAQLVGPRGGPVRRMFPRRTPEYVRLEQAPIIEPGEPVRLPTGEELACSVKYYTFAVAVVQLDLPFACEWDALLKQASRWMDAADIQPLAREIARRHLEKVAPGVIRLNSDWLEESYFITSVEHIMENGSEVATAAEFLTACGPQLAQLVHGETAPLAPAVTEEVLGSSASYYQSDLVVVGPSSALIYDRSEDAAATFQVLEYAKMQLLEFRYYDGLMTRLLSDVYDRLETRGNVLRQRWSLPRDAERFNTIRLDVMELTERIDNAVKFVSDVYYARVYRMAANRIGLPDYRHLVDEKLRTMGDLYDFMMDEFNEARSFVLELAVVVLALFDVILFAVLLARGGYPGLCKQTDTFRLPPLPELSEMPSYRDLSPPDTRLQSSLNQTAMERGRPD
jgi:hypothetical protein